MGNKLKDDTERLNPVYPTSKASYLLAFYFSPFDYKLMNERD